MQYVEDFEESDDEADIEEAAAEMRASDLGGMKLDKAGKSANKASKGGRKKRELEYEEETEVPAMKTRSRGVGW